MENDIITIMLDDGTKKDMELVLLYNDQITNTNYVLYKDIDNNDECYAAKYFIVDNVFRLDSNLNKMEIAKLDLLLTSRMKEMN